MEKSGDGGGLTVRLTAAECVRVPLVPEMVSVKVPLEAVVALLQVSVEEPEPPLIEVGFKLHEVPLGTPLTLRFTVPVKPLSGLTVAV